MKFKKGTIAASLALMLLAVGAVGITAFAANTGSNALPAQSSAAAPANAETDTEQDVENEQDGDAKQDVENEQDQAALAAQAKLTEADAIAVAEAANSGYKFTVDELDSENGVVTYDLKGTDAAGAELEVKVNAIDGAVMPEADGEYEG